MTEIWPDWWCDMARYRAAEPEKPTAVLYRCRGWQTCLGPCAHANPHEKNRAGRYTVPCVGTGPTCACIPVPSPEPAPVREIDREELQRKIVHAHLAAEFLPEPHQKILHGLVDDLEALADGKARIRGTVPVGTIRPIWCRVSDKRCNKPHGISCVECADFQEAAADYCRDTGWKEPR